MTLEGAGQGGGEAMCGRPIQGHQHGGVVRELRGVRQHRTTRSSLRTTADALEKPKRPLQAARSRLTKMKQIEDRHTLDVRGGLVVGAEDGTLPLDIEETTSCRSVGCS